MSRPYQIPNATVLGWAKRNLAGESYAGIGRSEGRTRSQVHHLIQMRKEKHPGFFGEILEAEALWTKTEQQAVLRRSRFNCEERMSFRQIEILEGLPQGQAGRRYRTAQKRWPQLELPDPILNLRKETVPTEKAVQLWHAYGRLRDWNLAAKECGAGSGLAAARLCKRRQEKFPELFPPHPHDPFAFMHPGTLEKARRIRALIQGNRPWDEIAEALETAKRTCQGIYDRVRKRAPDIRDWPLPGRKDYHTADDAYRWAVSIAGGKRMTEVARANGIAPKTVKDGIRRAAKAQPSRFAQLGNIKARQAAARRRERDGVLKRFEPLLSDHSWAAAARIVGVPPRTLRHWKTGRDAACKA